MMRLDTNRLSCLFNASLWYLWRETRSTFIPSPCKISHIFYSVLEKYECVVEAIIAFWLTFEKWREKIPDHAVFSFDFLNPLMPDGNKKGHTFLTKPVYMWPFFYHQALKGLTHFMSLVDFYSLWTQKTSYQWHEKVEESHRGKCF